MAQIPKAMTMKQFIQHISTLPNAFSAYQLSIKNDVGNKYVDAFKGNFDTKSFFGKVQWPAAKVPKKHPLMYETGKLKNSIAYKIISPNEIEIATHERCADKGRSSTYADFHNDPMNDIHAYRSKYKNNIHRQFIGDDPDLEAEVSKLILNSLVNKLKPV